MTKNYLNYKEIKKSFALKGTIVLIALAIIFAVILIRFAISGSKGNDLNGAPDSDIAYSMAKEFVKPTLKFSNISFQESGYQCAQKPDSTFIIKSYAESKSSNGDKNVTTFEITLKFTGGLASDIKSWKVVGLTEN